MSAAGSPAHCKAPRPTHGARAARGAPISRCIGNVCCMLTLLIESPAVHEHTGAE